MINLCVAAAHLFCNSHIMQCLAEATAATSQIAVRATYRISRCTEIAAKMGSKQLLPAEPMLFFGRSHSKSFTCDSRKIKLAKHHDVLFCKDG